MFTGYRSKIVLDAPLGWGLEWKRKIEFGEHIGAPKDGSDPGGLSHLHEALPAERAAADH